MYFYGRNSFLACFYVLKYCVRQIYFYMDHNKEQTNKLEAFLNNYGNFVGECTNSGAELDIMLKDFSQAIPMPNTENPQILELYNKGRSLGKELNNDLVPKLKTLKEDKLQDLIIYIEQLQSSLNAEYEKEINRSIDLGIYHKNIP